MDTPLAGERIAEEKAFAKRYVDTIGARKVEYPSDYAPPLESRPRKVPVLHVPIAPPPDVEADAAPQDATINLHIKAIAPVLRLQLTARLSDSVAELKAIIAGSDPAAPPADAQRLLLGGKVLSDSRLLKEYGIVEGSTLNLIRGIGAAKPAPAAVAPAPSETATLPVVEPTPQRKRGHMSTPSLTITTEDSETTDYDPTRDRTPEPPSPITTARFHTTISNPEFWQKVYTLCQDDFGNDREADTVFDTFLCSMKSRLSANESAKIRDVVGVDGMGGGV